jgi:hypothetical protein
MIKKITYNEDSSGDLIKKYFEKEVDYNIENEN